MNPSIYFLISANYRPYRYLGFILEGGGGRKRFDFPKLACALRLSPEGEASSIKAFSRELSLSTGGRIGSGWKVTAESSSLDQMCVG